MSLTKIQPSGLDQTLNYSVDSLTANTITVGGVGFTDVFNAANSGSDLAQAAYTEANTASGNTIVLQGVTDGINTAITAVDTLAAASYEQANIATTYGSQGLELAGYANTLAQSSYDQSNTVYAWGNHASQGYATETYVGTAISNLVDSAPTTLDTLNELAAALGDDANFATTVATNIGYVNNKANSAFEQANVSLELANAAFTKANTGGTGAGITYTASNTVPETANVGDQWFNINQNILYEYVSDGTVNTWIDITSATITSNASPSTSPANIDTKTIVAYSFLNMGA